MIRFTFGDDRVDIRGWEVYSNDAHMVGSVESFFIDMHAKAVRYVGIALHDTETGAPTGTVLVPVGAVVRRSERRVVMVRALSSAQLAAAPRLPNRPITRADEDATLAVYGMATSRDVSAVDLYNGPNFAEHELFGARDGGR
ncbi:MAG: PRC-barrel domain-containing protein [bacterium]